MLPSKSEPGSDPSLSNDGTKNDRGNSAKAKEEGSAGTQSPVSKKSALLQRIVAVCTLGSFLFGYDTGVINGALPFMRKDLGLSPVLVGVVTSSLLVGAACGALLSGHFSDRFGRRPVITALSLVFIVSTLGCALAAHIGMLVAFRFVLGLAVGGASSTVPVYFAELSPVEHRGQIVTWSEFMIVFGQLVAFITNAVLGSIWSEHIGIWRWMLCLAVIPAIALLVGALTTVPESPRWLLASGRPDEALAVLRCLRASPSRADYELSEMSQQLVSRASDAPPKMDPESAPAGGAVTNLSSSPRWMKISGASSTVTTNTVNNNKPITRTPTTTTTVFGLVHEAIFEEPWLLRCMAIGAGVAACQQVTGVNSVMYYGTEILRENGLDTQAALFANIGNGAISVVSALVSIWLLGRQVGRRSLILAGQSGVVVVHLLIGACSLVLTPGWTKGMLTLALTVTFMAFQQGTISPVTWLVMSAMFPLRVRGIGMGLTTFLLWTINCAIGLFFPILVEAVGISTTFFGFAAIGVLALGFSWRWFPETRAKSLETLEAQFVAQDRYALRRSGSTTKLGSGRAVCSEHEQMHNKLGQKHQGQQKKEPNYGTSVYSGFPACHSAKNRVAPT